MIAADEVSARAALRASALRLALFTLGWAAFEAFAGIALALAAGSVALLGFGADSLVEVASAAVLVWRLRAERSARDPAAIMRLDLRARRFVAVSLVALALVIVSDAILTLVRHEQPRPTVPGIVLTVVTIGVMYWLARAKRRAAAGLASCALRADAFQATACMWLSAIALAGMGLNAAFGWWWADPVAALCMPPLLAQEARKAWRGETCGC